jgi:predicted TIM-barrel fold metal-dependent hydrolase
MPEVKAAATNIWYDSAASLFLYRPDVFAQVATICSPEKLLWASDYPLITQSRMLAYAESSGLDAGALALALGENAARLFGLGERPGDSSRG